MTKLASLLKRFYISIGSISPSWVCFCFNTPKSKITKIFNRVISCWSNTQNIEQLLLMWSGSTGFLSGNQAIGEKSEARRENRKLIPRLQDYSPRGWDWPCRQAIKFYHILYPFRFFSPLFARISVFTDSKMLLINGYFNFTAFICVVNQKKCVSARLCVADESVILHSTLLCYREFLGTGLVWSLVIRVYCLVVN